MAGKISIDIDQLANDIATCQSKITRMNELLNEIENKHLAQIKDEWQSSAGDTLLHKYETTVHELAKSIQLYNTLNSFLTQVAEAYKITEKVNNLQKNDSGKKSAFSE